MGTTPTEPTFRVGFYGYDREEVDTYVRTLTSERNELRHRVDELESTLKATVEYLQSRQGPQLQISQDPPADDSTGSGPPVAQSPNRRRKFTLASAWSILLLILVIAASASWRGRTVLARSAPKGPAAVLAPVVVPAPVQSASNPTHTDTVVPPDAVGATGTTASTAPQPDGLIVSLATATECWIGIAIDGERHIERLLQHDEQFSVHARSDLLLRVGNAGAVSFRINGRAAKPLGPAGQPATARITAANFEQFLAQADSP